MNRSLTAIVLIIIAIGLYFTVTKTILADASKINASNKEFEKALENVNVLLKKEDELNDKYKRLGQTERDRLEKMVPQKMDNIRLIIDLNNIAYKFGFVLKGIQATASTANTTAQVTPSQPGSIPVPTLETVTVTFGVTAPYQQFITFLQELEKSLRILDISSLSVTSSDSGIYDWKVELKTYWLKK
jgi:Tfp pilus assembly protein PilO